MSSLLYFFPGSEIVPSGKPPRSMGQEPILAGGSWSHWFPCSGPEDSSGCVIAIFPEGKDGVEPRGGYYPQEQEWTAIHQHENAPADYWIGYERDNPPTPEDLIRRDAIGGWPVRLADGLDWQVPVLPAGRTTLPRRFLFSAGKASLVVKEPYRSLVERGEKWYECARVSPEGQWPGIDETYLFACDLLRCNYYLSRDEVSALALIDSHNVMRVIEAALAVPMFQQEDEARKKSGIRAAG